MGFETAIATVEEACRAGRIPGAVLGTVTLDGETRMQATGYAQLVPEKAKMRVETWFDPASLTKVIFTTERILGHATAGRSDLDQPLVSVLPDLRQYDLSAWEREITFRQCLGHQTFFPAAESIYTYGTDPGRLRAFVLKRECKPGRPVYSDINFILLGIALERIEGCGIYDMKPGEGFTFSPPVDQTAATEHYTWRGRVMRGEVHDENAFALQGAGHAGLFGTVEAVLGFARRLLQRDAERAQHIKVLRTPLSPTRAHGWEIAHEGWFGRTICSPSTIGHTGFTGTGLWIDFEAGRAWTLLTNRVHPSRPAESGIAELPKNVGTKICEGV